MGTSAAAASEKKSKKGFLEHKWALFLLSGALILGVWNTPGMDITISSGLTILVLIAIVYDYFKYDGEQVAYNKWWSGLAKSRKKELYINCTGVLPTTESMATENNKEDIEETNGEEER